MGNRVITASDLDRQIRVTAFQDGVKPDFSPAHKRTIAGRDDRAESDPARTGQQPLSAARSRRTGARHREFKKTHFKDEAEYQAALAAYGITEDDFKELLLWQRTLLLFIQVRFETGVQLSTQEVEDYFAKTVKPAAEAAHPGQPVSLDDYRDQIERKLTGQRADQQMDIWLRDVRKPHRCRGA